jgi:hypothetical protein
VFRISVRELLVVVALIALAIVSLKYVTEGWRTAVYSITMALFMVAAIVAVVDRGARQAAAIGFVLTATIYGFIVTNGSKNDVDKNIEFNILDGHLPTTRFTRYFRQPVTTIRYLDSRRQELINYDPENRPRGVDHTYFREITSPDPIRTMQIAHCWWALLLGYVGSKVARFVYVRRTTVAADAHGSMM